MACLVPTLLFSKSFRMVATLAHPVSESAVTKARLVESTFTDKLLEFSIVLLALTPSELRPIRTSARQYSAFKS